MRIGVLHGPSLNLLGEREPERYGRVTLAEIDVAIAEAAQRLGVEAVTLQSNHEGELIDWIQANSSTVEGWIVNLAGYTHTSVALRDALAGSGLPFVEVHLTNIYAREAFRCRSLLADAALGVITGFGPRSYMMGLEALVEHIGTRR